MLDEDLRSTILELTTDLDKDELRDLPLDWIKPNKAQDRKIFDEKKLQILATSIAQIGIQVPILVKEIKKDEEYEIIAGERRYRAAHLAKLTTIPAIIRKQVTENKRREAQFAENIHREDLNAVEKALAITRLIKLEGYKQRKIAELCGKSEAWVSKQLAILEQPKEIQEIAKSGAIKDLNTLYSIGKLDTDERKHIINQVKQGTFNNKLLKEIKEFQSVIKENKFELNTNELKALFTLTKFDQLLKKTHPNWKRAKSDALNKLFLEFKSYLNAKTLKKNK